MWDEVLWLVYAALLATVVVTLVLGEAVKRALKVVVYVGSAVILVWTLSRVLSELLVHLLEDLI